MQLDCFCQSWGSLCVIQRRVVCNLVRWLFIDFQRGVYLYSPDSLKARNDEPVLFFFKFQTSTSFGLLGKNNQPFSKTTSPVRAVYKASPLQPRNESPRLHPLQALAAFQLGKPERKTEDRAAELSTTIAPDTRDVGCRNRTVAVTIGGGVAAVTHSFRRRTCVHVFKFCNYALSNSPQL